MSTCERSKSPLLQRHTMNQIRNDGTKEANKGRNFNARVSPMILFTFEGLSLTVTAKVNRLTRAKGRN